MDGGIMSRDWSAEYNEFPMEIRTICAGLHCNIRIQHLNYEKDRLKQRYYKSCAEINDHIKNLEQELLRMEKE